MEDFSLCVCAYGDGRTSVFVFPLKSVGSQTSSGIFNRHNHKNKKINNKISPLLTCTISPLNLIEFVVLNSTIYVTPAHVNNLPSDPLCCPSTCPGHGRHMFYCDLGQSSHLVWKQAPLTLGSAFKGRRPIVVDQVIYVIGGESAREPIIEAFCSNEWIRLTPPPLERWLEDIKGYPSIFAVLDNPKRIILATCLSKYFYIYYVNGNFWSLKPILTGASGINYHHIIFGRAAVIGQTMYWFANQGFRLIAFDLEDNRWTQGRIKGLATEEDFESTVPILNHLYGDMLILVWRTNVDDCNDRDPDDHDYYRNRKRVADSRNIQGNLVHCAMIRVPKIKTKVEGEYGLKAYLESCECYETNNDIDSLSDAFVM